MVKIVSIAALIILVLVVRLNVFSAEMEVIFTKEINEICEKEANIGCVGNCQDGFNEECYFDSARLNKGQLETDFFMPNLPKDIVDICFAIHSYSVCGKCSNVFKLRKNDKLEEVSCEEFYKAIKEKNDSCGCVDMIKGGCC